MKIALFKRAPVEGDGAMRKALALIVTLLLATPPSLPQQKDSVYYSKLRLPGVRMIRVAGKYKVWTQKVGKGRIKLLLLHGGPGNTHEYLENFADYLPKEGIQIYFYDQLGSYFSDQPKVVSGDPLWKVSRMVEEVEEVRKGLGLKRFYLYGHSWGAILGLAYTIKYQNNLKGFIFSSMNASEKPGSERRKWVNNQIDLLIQNDSRGREIIENKNKGRQYDTAKYKELFDSYFTKEFVVRTKAFPEVGVRVKRHLNKELAVEVDKDIFYQKDYFAHLPGIKIPVLLIAGRYDFLVSEQDLEGMHKLLPRSRVVVCPRGGHMAMLDSPNEYFPPIIEFLRDVEANDFNP